MVLKYLLIFCLLSCWGWINFYVWRLVYKSLILVVIRLVHYDSYYDFVKNWKKENLGNALLQKLLDDEIIQKKDWDTIKKWLEYSPEDKITNWKFIEIKNFKDFLLTMVIAIAWPFISFMVFKELFDIAISIF